VLGRKQMRILIAGADGYIGWPLAQYLTLKGHLVGGIDALCRRRWVREMRGHSAIPISPLKRRLEIFRNCYKRDLQFWQFDLCNYSQLSRCLVEFRPDAVVHLAECPSAPYSMIDVEHAKFVQNNNLNTTFNLLFAIRDICPQAHLVKIGTMGEYGTPNLDIAEGFFEVKYRGRRDRVPFPRQATSWYHWSKVHGSNNLMFACQLWGISATDIMQGIVFGIHFPSTESDSNLWTRLDFDQAFGTVANRFCCQAIIGSPLTVYGGGRQQRSFIPLRESLECLGIILENPAEAGQYRVLNQFQRVLSLAELASSIKHAASEIGLTVNVCHIENPREEMSQHYYKPDHEGLLRLGYRPADDLAEDLRLLIRGLSKFAHRVAAKRDVLIPDIRWKGKRQKSKLLLEQAEGTGTA
jgi:UDP-sulfoquinovose synthase